MPPAQHSSADETAFMEDLFSTFDVDAFFAAEPSPCKPRSSRPTARQSSVSPTKRVYKADTTDVDLQALTAGAESWNWDDMEEDFLSPSKRKQNKSLQISQANKALPSQDSYSPQLCTRCVIVSVVESFDPYQKTLAVRLDPGTRQRQIVLCDEWADTDLRKGDVINIVGPFAEPTVELTTQTPYLLIAHPDHLLPPTSLSSASHCIRRSLLSILIRSSSSVSPGSGLGAMVFGSILHGVVQECLQNDRWDERWVRERVDDGIKNTLGDLVTLDMSEGAVRAEVTRRAGGVTAFGKKYIAKDGIPKVGAVMSDSRLTVNAKPARLAISRLLSVEEDIWAPMYGLKGKLDAVVLAHIVSSTPSPDCAETRTSGPLPLEIKTGRPGASLLEHRAQTLLYTLLLEARTGQRVGDGLLWYTQAGGPRGGDDGALVRVPRNEREVRALVGVRNRLAGALVRRVDSAPKAVELQAGGKEKEREVDWLPKTIDDERICNRCYVSDACMLYKKAVEKAPEDRTSPIYSLYTLKTSHLTSAQCDFFARWDALLTAEEGDLVRFRRELWTMRAAEREAKGRCWADMRMDRAYVPPDGLQSGTRTGNRIHQHTVRFVRGTTKSAASLMNGHIGIGDAVTVSVEPRLLALARGFVLELLPGEVILGIDNPLDLQKLTEEIELWKKIDSKFSDNSDNRMTIKTHESQETLFRIDKDELSGGMARVRDNLARLFYTDEDGGDSVRRALIVDLKSPQFAPEAALDPWRRSLDEFCAHLNDSQRIALARVLRAEDYALVLGMPGTGKTTLIATLIRVLVQEGKSVLLASYTHSAVDTILMRLEESLGNETIGILRLGNVDKVHPDIRKYTLAERRTATAVEQLEHQLMTPPVVATTCLSIDHPLFSRRKFDFCIIDEASQITLPTCLGPLRFADRFVLVGDHFQLPPLVKNPIARKGGLDVSLFRRLSDAHPHSVVDLTYQYRMNEDIMLLSNKLIYNNRLQCGSEKVAKRGLVLPDRKFLDNLHGKAGNKCEGGTCWIESLLSENCKAVFVDTDALPAPDSRVGDLVQNSTEASLVHQLVVSLLESGVQPSKIGIISLYRQQIKLLGHLLESHKGIEILTADRSQGRDKECIIISMVRSNENRQVGDLMKDWRRMNVSFTRARSKLVVIGSRKTLEGTPLLTEFLFLMEQQGWIFTLLSGAEKIHAPALTAGKVSPSKRTRQDSEGCASTSGENVGCAKSTRPPGKKVKKIGGDEGLLRGRPVLQDVFNGMDT